MACRPRPEHQRQTRGWDAGRTRARQGTAGTTSKRGDKYVRSLLVAGAVAVLRHTRNRTTEDVAWLRGLLARRPTKLAAVTLALQSLSRKWRGRARKLYLSSACGGMIRGGRLSSCSTEGGLNVGRLGHPVGDQKLAEHARLLRIEVERDDETELVVIDLHIAVDEA